MYPLEQLRRYPVKAMGGESLEVARLDSRGLVGDRWFAVEDAGGRFAAGKNTRRFRRHDEVFDYTARVDGERVLVTDGGHTWDAGSPELDAELSRTFGERVRVLPEGDVPHFDVTAVSLVGTASMAWAQRVLGADPDPRRLRPNLVLETDEPFVEEDWVGQELRIGEVVLKVLMRTERCRVVDLAQDGAVATRLLKPLADTRDMCLGMYAEVVTPGVVHRGEYVEVVG